MENDITVILNLFKRPNYLEEQLEAIKAQTVQPSQIWLWINHADENKKFKVNRFGFDRVFRSSVNCKFHARFAVGLMAPTKYVALFDDDTIPGDMWLENCVSSIQKTPGLYGGVGCIMEGKHYHQHRREGWPSNNEDIERVDLLGHAWFLETQNLKYMWSEKPMSLDNGEDIQLAYLAQKYGGLNCYCPPHPKDNPRLHSSLKANKYGGDSKASSMGRFIPIPMFYAQRDELIHQALCGGWETINPIKL